jgi:hypothetical protein
MPGIISGRHWIEERRRHLKAALENNPSEEQRQAIQQELDRLEEQHKSVRRRFRRWIFWGGRPPGD